MIKYEKKVVYIFSAGTLVDGKQVISASKRAVDDLFPDLGVCLDCCGEHPCCNDCGLGGILYQLACYLCKLCEKEQNRKKREKKKFT